MAFKIPCEECSSELKIKKSHFLSRLIPLSTESNVRILVKKIKEEHPQARHIVFAFISGEHGDKMGMSDDGEPHGTAGKPMLEVLKNSGITMILVVVIRYFGGVKLGTGGLVQAYTRAVQDVLSLGRYRELIPRSSVFMKLDYSVWNQLESRIPEFEGECLDFEYTEKVNFKLILPDHRIDKFSRFWRDLSRGEEIKFTSLDLF